MKIALNRCYGGFPTYDLPEELQNCERNDERLIAYCEANLLTLNAKSTSLIEIVEIPNEVHWLIDEYDGYERVMWSQTEIFTV